MLDKYTEPFLAKLAEQRYDRSTVLMCRKVVNEFTIYIDGRVDRPEDISSEHVRAYVGVLSRRFARRRRRPIRPRYQERLAHCLSLFSKHLVTQGVRTGIPFLEKQDLRAVPGFEDLLAEYEEFLIRHRGLQPGTISNYLDHAARLCKTRSDVEPHRWNDLTAPEIYQHLRVQARTLGHLGLRNAQTALRSFFRFLRTTGKCQKELDIYLIGYQVYSLSRVPQTVSVDGLRRLFDDVQGDDRSRIRDRAVLLLLTVYGLRIGEVVRLRLEDVQWRHQKFVVRQRKAGKDLVLPLLPVVARALWKYVEQARPKDTPYREVFLTRRLSRPYSQGAALGGTLRTRWQKLGLRMHPHALRHTLASHLINNDCPPEWIQVLLGHARFVSTQWYAKVDMTHLREVADNDAGGLL